MIHDPLTKLQCSPTSDGAACAIVASERYVDSHNLWEKAIEIVGQSMVTDLASTFDENADCMTIVGSEMSRTAAAARLRGGRVAAHEVDVCELHDCFSANELITYEALGFAAEGEAHKLVEAEATTFGGQVVVNPSGGLISKGHPLGATGLAQCSELTWQLRGEAGKRQVEGARVALQHNIGLGGAAVVTVYKPVGLSGPAGGGVMAKERRSLNGKVVAITGGARGIGKATAEALARRGARVAIGDVDLAMAEETAAGLGGGSIALALDVSDRGSFERSSTRPSGSSAVDVVINNAGIMPMTPFVEESRGLVPAPDRDQPDRRDQRDPAGDARG